MSIRDKDSLQLYEQQLIDTNFGGLHVWENIGELIGFQIARFFIIEGVPEGATRAGHAHKQCSQALCCVTGSVDASITSKSGTTDIQLSLRSGILVIPPMTWLSLINFKDASTSILVLCSHQYDEADYIRSFEHYKFLIS